MSAPAKKPAKPSPSPPKNDAHSRASGKARHRGDGRRHPSPSDFVPKRRDSSIGATSTNPRVRSASLADIAARSPRQHTPADFASSESKEAMQKLARLLMPVVMKAILRRRRQRSWPGGVYPPRRYTAASVVSAITTSKSILSQWPADLLDLLAQEATFHYLRPAEIIVYLNESHMSTGLLVLLHGQLSEERRRPQPATRLGSEDGSSRGGTRKDSLAERPISSQRTRTRHAPDVMCAMPVLCEDRSLTCLSCQPANESADVAVIPSRWFWQAFQNYVLESPYAGVVLQSFRDNVVPQRREMLLSTYYATSVVLQRSWMWPFLGGSDRVKLARAMDVKVLGVGDVLCEEGRYDPYMYILRRGTLTVVVKGEPLALIDAGTAFGEESVFFADPRSSAVVAGSVCELYCLHVSEFKHRVNKYPKLLETMVPKALARRTRWLETGQTRDIFGLVSLLGGVPCLSHTTDSMREAIACTATVITVPAGQKLAVKDTLCDTLFVIGRGSVRVSAPESTSKPVTPWKGAEDVRTAGDFFGELCLRKHFWPTSAVSETTTDLWMLSANEVRRVLATNKADVQAEEVCRQGIALFRAQNGESSIREEFDDPPLSAAATAMGARKASLSHRRSSPGVSGMRSSSSGQRGSSPSLTSVIASQPQAPDLVKELEHFDWVAYCRERIASLVSRTLEEPGGSAGAFPPALPPPRDLEPADKEVEKALSHKVLAHVSVPREHEPNAADVDFPAEVDELQAIIVEQLFLIPSVEQPKFLRQIGKSNVKLVAAEEDGGADVGFSPGATNNMNFESMCDLNDLGTELAGHDPFLSGGDVVHLEAVRTLAPDGTYNGDSDDDEDDRSAGASGRSPPFGSTVNEAISLESSTTGASGGAFRSRRSLAGPEDSAGSLGMPLQSLGLTHRASLTRSHLVRPPSGAPLSPRAGSSGSPAALATLISPRGGGSGSHGRPPGSTESRLSLGGAAAAAMAIAAFASVGRGGESGVAPGSSRGRPGSVDYTQQNKISADRSMSVLDRYVKIEDQDYFNTFVKVLPLQPDELWIPDDDAESTGLAPDALILTLMHVRACDHLAEDVLSTCKQPILKVSTGSKVLRRAVFLEGGNPCSPRWPIDVSSFITFVRRGVDIVFSICDAHPNSSSSSSSAAATDTVLYEATLSTSDINENGGVGQRVMSLHETDAVPPREETARPHRARMTVTMMAVTASKYKVLHNHLRASRETDGRQAARGVKDKDRRARTSEDDGNTCYLQIIGVDGLRHRVEASVTVLREADGAITKVMETPRVVPKTRTPCWPGSGAFATLRGEGYITFQVSHKDSVIGTCETTADELVFGGPGLRRLPLFLAHSGSEVIGQLVLRIVATKVQAGTAATATENALFLYTERFAMASSAADKHAVVPDPYIVIHSPSGASANLRGTAPPLLRTPLAIGSDCATWAVGEASCFISCPVLEGSEVSYQLEVHDNGDGMRPLGRAVLHLSREGLGPQSRYDVPLEGKKGTVRVTAMQLPVHRLSLTTAGPRPAIPLAASQDLLVLVHIAACRDLRREPNGGGSEATFGPTAHPYHHIDALVTMRLVRADVAASPDAPPDWSAVHLNTGVAANRSHRAPRWPLQDKNSTLLLRVTKEDVAMLQSEAAAADVIAVFEVFDGLSHVVDRVGIVRVPLMRLLGTATHRLTLRAAPPSSKDGKKSDGDLEEPTEGVSSSGPTEDADNGADGMDDMAYFSSAAVGVLEVETLCGSLDAQVWPVGSAVTDAITASAPPSPVRGGGITAKTPEKAMTPLLCPRVRLRLSSAANLAPPADAAKPDEAAPPVLVADAVTVTAARKVLLHWNADTARHGDAAASSIGGTAFVFANDGPGEVVVDLTQMQREEGEASVVRVELTFSVLPALSPVAPNDQPTPVTNGNPLLAATEPARLRYHAEIPIDAMKNLAADEVHVYTALLSSASTPGSATAAGRHATIGHGPLKKTAAPEMVSPTLTVALVGAGAAGQVGVTLNLER